MTLFIYLFVYIFIFFSTVVPKTNPSSAELGAVGLTFGNLYFGNLPEVCRGSWVLE